MRPSGIVLLVFAATAPGAAQEPAFPVPAHTPPPFRRSSDPVFQSAAPEDRPLVLAGRVMLADGLGPPEPVTVQLVCYNRVVAETLTSAKGRFTFQLAQSRRGASGANPLPRDPGAIVITEQQVVFCSLQAAAPGFRAEPLELGSRRGLSGPDAGVIVLHRREEIEGSTISATSLHAPEEARKALEKGREALKKKKAADAEKEFLKAVGIYPGYAAAWFVLGQVQEAQKRPEEARASYKRSLAADGKFVRPYLPLALMAAGERNWGEMAEASARLIRLDPYSFPQAYFYNSVANYNLGNLDAAEKSAREAQRLDARHRFPRAVHMLGTIMADRGQYAAAIQHMREYLEFASPQEAEAVRTRIAELERLAGSPRE